MKVLTKIVSLVGWIIIYVLNSISIICRATSYLNHMHQSTIQASLLALILIFQYIHSIWKMYEWVTNGKLMFQKCYRSSRPEVFCKKGVLKNLAKFTGKHQCQSLFFNKVAGLIKKETLAQVFSREFAKYLRTTFFIEHIWSLLLCLLLLLVLVSFNEHISLRKQAQFGKFFGKAITKKYKKVIRILFTLNYSDHW